MTISDVKAAVEAVREVRSDWETAHWMEDDLHRKVLRAIADDTCEDARICAAEALKTKDIEFPRYCA